MNQMQETPFFFANGRGQRLFGVLHEPADTKSRRGFVFCHPLAEEKLWAHRVFVTFARALAARGVPVLRFDMTGEGDSEGRFEDSTVESRLADIGVASDALRSACPTLESVDLLGLRLGATLAWEIACRRPGTWGRVVMWDPVASGQAYVQELLRANLANQMAVHGRVTVNRKQLMERMESGEPVNVEGYPLTLALCRELSTLELSGDRDVTPPEALALQLGRQGQGLRDDLAGFAARFDRVQTETVVEQPFWRETRYFFDHSDPLFDRTLAWLGERND